MVDGVEAGVGRSDIQNLLGRPARVAVYNDTLRLHFSEPGSWGTYEAWIVGCRWPCEAAARNFASPLR